MHNLKVDEAVKDALHWAVCDVISGAVFWSVRWAVKDALHWAVSETGNRAVVRATKGAEPGDPEHLISADFLHSAELA